MRRIFDSSVGVRAFLYGELEITLRMHILHNDNNGVAENLNETVCFNDNRTCESLINVNPTEKVSDWRRSQTIEAGRSNSPYIQRLFISFLFTSCHLSSHETNVLE